MSHTKRGPLAVWLAAVALVQPLEAWAYLDPNAGGILYQLLFPLIVAIGAAWAGLRYRIGHWWSRLFGKSSNAADERAASATHDAPAATQADHAPSQSKPPSLPPGSK